MPRPNRNITLTGKLINYNGLNRNKRRYAKEAMKAAVEDLKERVKFGTAIGGIDVDYTSGVLDLRKASHIVRDVKYEALPEELEPVREFAAHWLGLKMESVDRITADIEVMSKTPDGRIVLDLLEADMELNLEPRFAFSRDIDQHHIVEINILSLDVSAANNPVSIQHEDNDD